MAWLGVVLFLLTKSMVQSQATECCATKMVGGVSYTLQPGIFDGEIPPQCLNDCVYAVSGTFTPKFCFRRGDLSTECLSNPTGLQPIHAVDEGQSSNMSIQVSCDELKNMHHAVGRARVAYHCSSKPATGKQRECDQRLLQDLNSCSSAESGYCFFQLIAEEEVCYPPNNPNEACDALDRVYSFLLYARMAFCQRPVSRSGCTIWNEMGCTSQILAASAGCAAVNIADAETLTIPCIVAVLGFGSLCPPCICDVLGTSC